jgi:hypothetical protein
MITGNLENKLIREAIVKTIVFFDLFDFPLTNFEIWQSSGVKCSLVDIVSNLKHESLEKAITLKQGYFCLSGREQIINKRKQRYNQAQKKYKKAMFVLKIFRYIPWIRMIAVGNVIGASNWKKESDIDLFIITKAKRIWISRFFCILITLVLRLRPKENNIQDKICLSFFISEEQMNIQSLKLRRQEQDDKYFTFWLSQLMPIYDKDDCYKEFIKENQWIFEYLPNWQKKDPTTRRKVFGGWGELVQEVIDLFIGGLEGNFKKWQINIMPANLKKQANKDTRIVVSDKVLKFHSNDRREEIMTKYQKSLNNALHIIESN